LYVQLVPDSIAPWPTTLGLTRGAVTTKIRLEEHKLCLLVMIGVRADGRKELIALADGYRESTESWADLLRDCAHRGMRAPVLAVGDGALGFWAALREVFPEAREGRCWFHKTANVLVALPKSAHPRAKKALAEIWGAEDKQHALAAVTSFKATYGAKFPKAVAKVTDDLSVFPTGSEHGKPLPRWLGGVGQGNCGLHRQDICRCQCRCPRRVSGDPSYLLRVANRFSGISLPQAAMHRPTRPPGTVTSEPSRVH
jgi:Transposase, Mutator family